MTCLSFVYIKTIVSTENNSIIKETTRRYVGGQLTGLFQITDSKLMTIT